MVVTGYKFHLIVRYWTFRRGKLLPRALLVSFPHDEESQPRGADFEVRMRKKIQACDYRTGVD